MNDADDALIEEARRNLPALAACILKAGLVKHSWDQYWHTREACVKIAGQTRGGIVTLISLIHSSEFKCRKDLDELTKLYWAEVAHPDVLLKEVHET
jgi:biotin synthase-related radical SAM superfamily protein